MHTKLFLLTNPNFKTMPSFNSNTGSNITLTEATAMTSAWATLQSTMSIPINASNPKSMAYGKNKIQDILDQQGCEGIRIYNGYSDSNRVMVVVGVDENGNDMTGGNILEWGMPCPASCPPSTAIG